MKKKLILFDWGNIVESHDVGYSCGKAWNDLFRACGYTGDEDVFKLSGKYRVCIIPTVQEFEEAYHLMASDFDFHTSYSEFIQLYKEIFAHLNYYRDVSEYEKSLKDRCYIGIFSDLTVFDKERLDSQVDLSQYDYVFLSFEMGHRKTGIELYGIVNEQLPFSAQDILFIDDKQSNLDFAKKFGWQTFRATGLELDKIQEVCEKFLLEE